MIYISFSYSDAVLHKTLSYEDIQSDFSLATKDMRQARQASLDDRCTAPLAGFMYVYPIHEHGLGFLAHKQRAGSMERILTIKVIKY